MRSARRKAQQITDMHLVHATQHRDFGGPFHSDDERLERGLVFGQPLSRVEREKRNRPGLTLDQRSAHNGAGLNVHEPGKGARRSWEFLVHLGLYFLGKA